MKIKVVDAIMGIGKTSACINMINNSREDDKYMFVTPYLQEVTRVIDACPAKHICEPKSYGTKKEGLKCLLRSRRNIATTHKLFSTFDTETIKLIRDGGYSLILDEVMDVVEELTISTEDKEILLQLTIPDRHNILRCKSDTYKGLFREYMNQCMGGSIALHPNGSLMKIMPIRYFEAFKEVYVLTYMFDCQIQKYYFDVAGAEYQRIYVRGDTPETYHLTTEPVQYEYPDYSKLIHILDNKKMNKIGEGRYTLSHSWYTHHTSDGSLIQLKNNCKNFFINIMKTKGNDNLWTTYKEYKGEISGCGYARGFTAINTRATNQFADRHSVAYTVNRFISPQISSYFHTQGISIDHDSYALSELLQFLWRSAIRNKEEISLYIPSERMRNLLINWINNTKSHSEEVVCA